MKLELINSMWNWPNGIDPMSGVYIYIYIYIVINDFMAISDLVWMWQVWQSLLKLGSANTT